MRNESCFKDKPVARNKKNDNRMQENAANEPTAQTKTNLHRGCAKEFHQVCTATDGRES
jgi:hypothetical protein